MKAPIKERIVVLRYKRLDETQYREIYDSLTTFMSSSAEVPYVAERLNFPHATLPVPTTGEHDPDWAQFKVAIEYNYRFWNQSRTRCVQLFHDYMTVNLIENDKRDVPGSHEELFAFFETILPFISKHRKSFALTSAGIDYFNHLDSAQLAPYLINNGLQLEITKLFRGDMIGCGIPHAMPVAPLSRRTVYGPDPSVRSQFPAQLVITINIPNKGPNEKHVDVLFSASGKLSDLSRDNVMKFLEAMHKSVYDGFCATFSKDLIQKAKEASV